MENIEEKVCREGELEKNKSVNLETGLSDKESVFSRDLWTISAACIPAITMGAGMTFLFQPLDSLLDYATVATISGAYGILSGIAYSYVCNQK